MTFSAMVRADSLGLVIWALAIAAVLAISCGIYAAWQRHLVSASSRALVTLAELNEKHRLRIVYFDGIRANFAQAVNSKGRFDRFDLSSFLMTCVIEREPEFVRDVNARNDAIEKYGKYDLEREEVVSALFGASSHPRVSNARYAAIERRLVERQSLPRPTRTARVRASVSYTSPAGKNSYSRRLEWNFDQLAENLRAAQVAREKRSTTASLRQRERALMTPRLRVEILQRDRYRCRMCGASASDGVALHVDHIHPVSKGGRTVSENLQALCQDCNLGKSDRILV